MSATPARLLVRDVITRVRERAAYSHEVMDSRIRRARLSPADTAFATRLAYGILQTQGTLDEAIDRYTTRPKIEPRVRDALRVGAYELLFLRTEPRAAVHQAVELVREARPQATSLANAVLRRLADSAPAFPWGDPDTDLEALARLHGHPLWLARLWVTELGYDTAAGLMAANNEAAPLYVAANSFAASVENARTALRADGALPQPCPVPGCVQAGAPAAAVRGHALREGLVLAVDAAAQLVVRFACPAPGNRVLEIGAGRGTKTLLLQSCAIQRGGSARIWALDVHAFKAELLAERVARFEIPDIVPLVGDATRMSSVADAPEPESIDVVLIDAPCSGLGTLRRHPEKRWRISPQDIETLAGLGSQLLEQAAALVRRGGFVVYSTCTITQRENASVIDAFLAGKEGSAWCAQPLADEVPQQWQHFVTGEGHFRSMPASGGPDGHFAARLVKS